MKHKTFKILLTSGILFFGFSVLIPSTIAQLNVADIPGKIEKTYEEASIIWESVIKKHAVRLFWYMAFFQLVVLAIKGLFSGYDFGDFLLEILKLMLIGGIFLALINHTNWIADLIYSFIKIGDEAAGATGAPTEINPGKAYTTGADIITRAWEKTRFLKQPITSFTLITCGAVVFCCFMLISLHMLLAYIEMYVTLHIGFILLAFSVFNATQQIGINYLQHVISIGLKIMVLNLLVGVGVVLMEPHLKDLNVMDFKTFIHVVGSSFVLAVLVKQVPAMIQGLFRGMTMTGGTGGMGALAGGVAAVVGLKTLKMLDKLGKKGGGELINNLKKSANKIKHPFEGQG